LKFEKKNDGAMDDKSGDDDTSEVRWSWRKDECYFSLTDSTVSVEWNSVWNSGRQRLRRYIHPRAMPVCRHPDSTHHEAPTDYTYVFIQHQLQHSIIW